MRDSQFSCFLSGVGDLQHADPFLLLSRKGLKSKLLCETKLCLTEDKRENLAFCEHKRSTNAVKRVCETQTNLIKYMFKTNFIMNMWWDSRKSCAYQSDKAASVLLYNIHQSPGRYWAVGWYWAVGRY